MVLWVDDCILFAKTFDQYMLLLETTCGQLSQFLYGTAWMSAGIFPDPTCEDSTKMADNSYAAAVAPLYRSKSTHLWQYAQVSSKGPRRIGALPRRRHMLSFAVWSNGITSFSILMVSTYMEII